MIKNNGKTKETSWRREDRECKNESSRLVELECNRSIYGDDEVGPFALHSSKKDCFRSTEKQGKPTVGKILERLEALEKSYMSYVDSHIERLETRLVEGREQRQAFGQEIQELKQEIYDLVSEEAGKEEKQDH